MNFVGFEKLRDLIDVYEAIDLGDQPHALPVIFGFVRKYRCVNRVARGSIFRSAVTVTHVDVVIALNSLAFGQVIVLRFRRLCSNVFGKMDVADRHPKQRCTTAAV